MAAIAHSPDFAKKVGVPQSVGKDFVAADKGKKFGTGGALKQGVNRPKTNHGAKALFKEGGMAKHDDLAEDKKLIKKAFGMHDKQLHESKKTDLTKLKGGGMAKETMGPRNMSQDVEKGSNKLLAHGESAVQKRGHTKGKNLAEGLRALGAKYKCPVITGVQVAKDAWNSSDITLESVPESKALRSATSARVGSPATAASATSKPV